MTTPVLEKEFRSAAYRGEVANLEKLRTLGVDINGSDGEGRNACHYACVSGKEESLSLLVTINADLNKADACGVTPLLLAVGKGHFRCALLLLKGGVAQDSKDKDGNTFVHYIALARQLAPEERDEFFSLADSSVIDLPNYRKEAPLHLACRAVDSDAVSSLIRSGASVAVQDGEGNTPLHILSRRGASDLLAVAVTGAGSQAGLILKNLAGQIPKESSNSSQIREFFSALKTPKENEDASQNQIGRAASSSPASSRHSPNTPSPTVPFRPLKLLPSSNSSPTSSPSSFLSSSPPSFPAPTLSNPDSLPSPRTMFPPSPSSSSSAQSNSASLPRHNSSNVTQRPAETTLLIVLHPYQGDGSRTLTLKKGDLIDCQRKVNENWSLGTLQGVSGLFPTRCTVPANLRDFSGTLRTKGPSKRSHLDNLWDGSKSDERISPSTPSSTERSDIPDDDDDEDEEDERMEVPQGYVPPKGVQCVSEALYTYNGSGTNTLEFEKGDLVLFIKSVNEKWGYGIRCDRSGVFPLAYIRYRPDLTKEDLLRSFNSDLSATSDYNLSLSGSSSGVGSPLSGHSSSSSPSSAASSPSSSSSVSSLSSSLSSPPLSPITPKDSEEKDQAAASPSLTATVRQKVSKAGAKQRLMLKQRIIATSEPALPKKSDGTTDEIVAIPGDVDAMPSELHPSEKRLSKMLSEKIVNFPLSPSEQNPHSLLVLGVDDEGEVKGGTVEGLVWCLFDHPQEKWRPWFVTCFLTTFLSFTTPTDLMRMIRVYYVDAEKYSSDAREMEVRRLRILGFIRKWMTSGYFEFDMDFIAKLREFVSRDILRINGQNPAQAVLSSIDKAVNAQLRPPPSLSISDILKTPTKEPSSKNVFDLNAKEVAMNITLMDFEKYSKIRPAELLNKSWISSKKAVLSPNVIAYIDNFNLIGNLVASTILKEQDIRRRTKSIETWIMIGRHLRNLNNLHGVVAVTSGLTLASIHRLKQTWARVRKKYIGYFTTLQDDTSSLNNYANLRHTYASCSPPCIPYLGVYLTDLVFLDDGNRTYLAEKVVNFSKCTLLCRMINDALQYQQVPYSSSPSSPSPSSSSPDPLVISSLFRTAVMLNEDEQYERSLVVEPRVST